MSLSPRAQKLAERILNGEIVHLIEIKAGGETIATTHKWRELAKETGMRIKTAEDIVYAVQRGLEDEEEVRLYFLNERNTGEKDDWIVLVGLNDPDGAIFVGITPGILNDVKTVMNLAMYVRDMVDSTRPYGRVFGPQPSAN